MEFAKLASDARADNRATAYVAALLVESALPASIREGLAETGHAQRTDLLAQVRDPSYRVQWFERQPTWKRQDEPFS